MSSMEEVNSAYSLRAGRIVVSNHSMCFVAASASESSLICFMASVNASLCLIFKCSTSTSTSSALFPLSVKSYRSIFITTFKIYWRHFHFIIIEKTETAGKADENYALNLCIFLLSRGMCLIYQGSKELRAVDF